MTAETKLTIAHIRTYVLRRKVYWLKGGDAIPEYILPDKPTQEDFVDIGRNLSPAPHNNAPQQLTQQSQPSQQLMQPTPSCPDIMSMLGMDAGESAETNHQITMDEAIDATSTDAAQQLIADAKAQAEEILKDARRQAKEILDDAMQQAAESSAAPVEDLPSNRFLLWLKARKEWIIEKRRKQYEYDMLRQKTSDVMIGFDETLAFLDELEAKWDEISPMDDVIYSRSAQNVPSSFDFQDGNGNGGGK